MPVAAPDVTLRGEETFADSNNWNELARQAGVRLPQWRMKATPGGMRRFLKKIGWSVDKYLDDNNEKTLKVFAQLNPDWPLRAWAGMQLENLFWEREHKPNVSS